MHAAVCTGSTKAEWTSQLVKEALPHLTDSDIITHEPDEACARGAAMLAERYTTNKIVNLKDTVALDVALVIFNPDLGRQALSSECSFAPNYSGPLSKVCFLPGLNFMWSFQRGTTCHAKWKNNMHSRMVVLYGSQLLRVWT